MTRRETPEVRSGFPTLPNAGVRRGLLGTLPLYGCLEVPLYQAHLYQWFIYGARCGQTTTPLVWQTATLPNAGVRRGWAVYL